MGKPWYWAVSGLLIAGTGAGCAGPTTPLGAVWSIRPAGVDSTHSFRQLAAKFLGGSQPRIYFDPPRQVLHAPRTVKLIIEDPAGIQEGYALAVRYHGHDITSSFLRQARVSVNRARSHKAETLVLEIPAVRLPSKTDHLIEVGYRSPSGRSVVSRYQGPRCRAFDAQGVRTIADFRPNPRLLKSIETISRQMGFSPAFATALIAQESAFNPRSVSIARAMGLTQVTPIAESEISSLYEDWPRYPGGNQLPAVVLKFLVMGGEINETNEWRMNPEQSIRGGLAFAQLLSDRWMGSDSFSKLQWTQDDSDAEVARTRLILASYNSGYSRVVQAISKYGAAWLTAPELKEARNYVNRIFSYCDAFQSDQEGFNENET